MGTNRQIHMELEPGWVDQTIYVFHGPDAAGIQHLLTVLIDDDPGEAQLDAYARDRIAIQTANQGGMVALTEGGGQWEDGTEFYEFVYRWNTGAGQPEYWRQVYVLLEGRAVTFSGRYAKHTSRTVGTEMDRMIRTFRVEGS
ncbi:MAG: DcrB-related protein [Gemmatimonadota bacterium]